MHPDSTPWLLFVSSGVSVWSNGSERSCTAVLQYPRRDRHRWRLRQPLPHLKPENPHRPLINSPLIRNNEED